MSDQTSYVNILNNITNIEKLGDIIARCGFFGIEKKGQADYIALTCVRTGRDPGWFLSRYQLVFGRLSKRASAVAVDFLRAGGKIKWLKMGDDDEPFEKRSAVGLFTSPDGVELKYEYSMTDAKIEGNLEKKDSRWVKRPGQMLRARCITNAIGALWPMALIDDLGSDEPEPTEPTEPIDPASLADHPAVAMVPNDISMVVEPKSLKDVLTHVVSMTETAQSPAPEQTATTEVSTEVGVAESESLPDRSVLLTMKSSELANLINQRIPEGMDNAVASWLMAKGWITTNDLRNLTVQRSVKILTEFKKFIATVRLSEKGETK